MLVLMVVRPECEDPLIFVSSKDSKVFAYLMSTVLVDWVSIWTADTVILYDSD